MKYVTHNTTERRINACGTSLQGHMKTTYATLVKKFGEPMGSSGDGKMKAEWMIRFPNGVVATIYDYKSDIDPVDFTDWHIGGHSPDVCSLLFALMSGADAVMKCDICEVTVR